MRILVIEDEHKIAQAIKEGLEYESYAVDVSYDSDDGLGNAITFEYDCMIIDRMLPGGVDGLETVRQIREEGVHTPVLLLTAKGEVRDKIDGLDAGADDYMIKPFAFEELLARLRALLRRPQATVNEELSSPSVVLNTRTHEVHRADTVVQLSRKEFALLEYFLRHQGQTLTKETIIAHVWDYDADILPNTVEAYIKYLREKLEKAFPAQPKLIHTVHGFGYKFEEKDA